MYGTTRTPFGNVVAADLHSQPQHQHQHRPTAASVATTGVLGHAHYPNYHLYNVPTGHGPSHGHTSTHGGHHHGHGLVMVGPALAHMYAAAAADGASDHRPIEMAEELLRRRGSGERRGSGSLRRNSGAGAASGTGTGSDATSGPPGKKQQRFEILRKLGSGTYGRVSLAMDHKAGEEVAVKVIRKSAIENTADLIRIRREIRIMSALKHPNIIEIKEVFENDEKIILVMEYASGGELYDYVGKHGPLQEDEVRRLFRQVVSAVYYCHKHGVAHRDLKLENILLDKEMGAKIADFGLSNYFTEFSKLRTFCGSPLYASPEIINGTPYRGPEVDCWSLGVLLYTLAYSSMPFDGRDFNRMARQIKRGAYYEPDPPSSASMLIRSMLRVCPERRATISDIAAHWWLNFDENGLAIADMPENQVIDSTPLYIRQETMMIQTFGEENEMFAEFTHLSDATRKKIEEYRRRRREAEWYLTECQTPLKKQSKKRSSSIVNDQKRQSSQAMAAQKQSREASVAASGAEVASRKNSNAEVQKKPAPPPQQQLQTQNQGVEKQPSKLYTAAEIAAGEAGGLPDDQLLDNLTDPLNRLKALESRLHKQYQKEKAGANRISDLEMQLPEGVPAPEGGTKRPSTLPLSERPPTAPASATSTPKKPKPSSLKMSVDDLVQEKRALDKAVDNATAASLVSAVQEDGNRMVNRLLEEAMKGTVSAELIESIRASEAYRTETFVKEILESVLAAQQTKPVATPSTPTARSTRKSKQASLTRIPTSGSTSSTAPLPDVIRQDSEKSTGSASVIAPPDVVAAMPDGVPTPQTPPIAATPLASMKLIYETVPEDAELQLPSAVDGEIVGEPPSTPASSEHEEDVCSTDFEDLEIDEEEDEAHRERRGEDSPLSGTGSFASTHSHVGDLPEIRTFAPATEAEEGKTVAEGAESEDNPFLRGLSKRMSRGKYEKSKYVLGRGISIEESPRSSRRRLAAEKRAAAKQAGQGSLEENETEPVDENDAGDPLADGAKSPRRRYSDGDKNHLDPMARREEWLQKADSDLGSSQENESPPPNPDTRFHYEELEAKKAVAPVEKAKEKPKAEKQKRRSSKVSDVQPATPAALTAPPQPAALPAPEQPPALPAPEKLAAIAAPPVSETLALPAPPGPGSPMQSTEFALEEAATTDLLSASQRRREERAKLKQGLRGENGTPTETPTPSPSKSELPELLAPEKKTEETAPPQPPSQPQPKPESAPPEVPKERPSKSKQFQKSLSLDQRNDSKPKSKEASVIPTEDPKPEVPVAIDGAPPLLRKKEGKKTKRPKASVSATIKTEKAEPENVEPEKPPVNEEKRVEEPQPAPEAQNEQQSKHEEPKPLDGNNEELQPDALAPADPLVPASNKTAEQRRHSYRTAMDNSLGGSQESDKNALPKSPTATTDYHTSNYGTTGGAPRSAKYHQSPSGVVTAAVAEPLWLQYAREETQRHNAQGSPYHHGYGAGDYKSSVTGHGYDDDYLGTRTSHLPQSSSYRVGSSYSSRDLSPPRTTGPSFRTHADPVDSYNPYGHQPTIGAVPTGAASRGRKPKPLYHQKSSDELGSHHYDDSLSSNASKRYGAPTNAVVSGYTPAYARRTTGSGDYYKSLYDDNVVYRRSHYDVQPEPEDDWKPSTEKDSTTGGSSGGQFRVFQPKGLMKRRSRSLDKSQARKYLPDNDDDQLESSPSYMNYHDTGSHHYQPTSGGSSRYESSLGTGVGVVARQPTADINSKSPLKSILKKQPTFDSSTSSSAYGRYGEPERKNSDGDGRSGAMNFIERLRRHLSNEKSPEPPDFVTSSNFRPKTDSTVFSGVGDNGALDYTPGGMYGGDRSDGKQGHKKRLMETGRRRTAEIRYGDGAPGYGDDYHYSGAGAPKRPTSPIEKIKGFFSGGPAKGGPTSVGGPSVSAPYHYSASTSPYSPYQPTPISGTNPTRDVGGINSNYGAGYRKPYQASTSGYRPTSYAPPSRYWHDDSSLY